MVTPVAATLRVDRQYPRVYRISVEGVDLSAGGSAWHAQVRLYPDAPGDPVLDLPQVSDPTAAGVRLVEVDTSGPLPVSLLDVQVPATASWPPAAEIGDAANLAWDFYVAPAGLLVSKWVYGPCVIGPIVTVPASTPALSALPVGAAPDMAVAFTAPDLVLSLAGGELFAPILAKVQAVGNWADAIGALQADVARLGYGGVHITDFEASPLLVELGDTVDVDLAWTVSGTVTAQTINGEPVDPAARGNVYHGVTQTTSYALAVHDGSAPAGAGGTDDSAVQTVQFLGKAYWGVVPTTAPTDDQLKALTQGFATQRARAVTYDASAGGYPVYAWPASLGDIASVVVGSTAFSAYTVTTRDVVNAKGRAVSMHILVFNGVQHGAAIQVTFA